MQSHLPSQCFKYMITFVRGFKTNQQIKQVILGYSSSPAKQELCFSPFTYTFFSGIHVVKFRSDLCISCLFCTVHTTVVIAGTQFSFIKHFHLAQHHFTKGRHLPIPQWILSLMEGRVYTRHRGKNTASPIAADQSMQGCLKPRSDLSS